MSRDNGRPVHERPQSKSKIDGEALERRSMAFARALNRKGMPMSYGGIGKPVEVPPMPKGEDTDGG